MANHFTDKNKAHKQNSCTDRAQDFTEDFHVFAMEWGPKEITWFLDNKKVFRSTTGIPNEKMYLVISMGVGGEFPGYADLTTSFPASFDVDYVRAYKKRNL